MPIQLDLTAPEKTRQAELLTGAEAVAHAMRQINPDVVPVYRITPQTPMVETFARFVADGRATSELVNVESEHSAMSSAMAAALAGGRTMTATASQGLALMIEVVYLASSMRAPVVMAVGNRALSGPINIHCDHSDSMLARDSGAIQLFARDAQEVYDLMVMAPRIAEHPAVLLPVLVCQDGFTVTHSAEPVELLLDEQVRDFVGEYHVPYALLDLDRATTHGPFAMPDYYYELRRQQVDAMLFAARAFREIAQEFATICGREYHAVEGYRLEDADCAVVVLGSTAGTLEDPVDGLRAAGHRVGVLSVRSFRPFPHGSVREALHRARRVAVLDRSLAPGSRGPLYCDVASALYGDPVVLREYVYGLGGRDLEPNHIRRLFDDLTHSRGRGEAVYLGLRA
ncbi:MAG: pyruvate ferredoxin oxidoreductase [Gemmatimonadetes bacterium]|nr:pyruvate ferredoxin oxidoreductase [Gemmatimonadota bacterium]